MAQCGLRHSHVNLNWSSVKVGVAISMYSLPDFAARCHRVSFHIVYIITAAESGIFAKLQDFSPLPPSYKLLLVSTMLFLLLGELYAAPLAVLEVMLYSHVTPLQ